METLTQKNSLITKSNIFILLGYIFIGFFSAYYSLHFFFIAAGFLIAILFTYLILFRTRTFFILLFVLLFVQQAFISYYTVYKGVKASQGSIVSRADDLIWMILLVIVFIKMIRNKESITVDNYDFSVLLLVLFSIFSILVNRRSLFWGGASILIMVKGYMIYFIVDKLKFKRKHIKYFLVIYFVSLLIIALIGLLQAVGLNPPMFKPQTRFGVKMINSIFNEHTQFGSIMAIAVALSLALLLKYKNKWYYFFIFLFTVCIILSTLRRSLLSVLVILLLVPLLDKGVSKKIYLPIIVVLAVFILIFHNQLLILIHYTFSDYIYNFYKTPRGQFYNGAFNILKHKFFYGEGPGTFAGNISALKMSKIYFKYNVSYDSIRYCTDAYYAHILGEIGMVGFILYFIMLGNVYKKINYLERYLKKENDSLILALTLFMKFVLIIGIMESSVSSFFEIVIKTAPLFATLGIISSYYRNKIHDENKSFQ